MLYHNTQLIQKIAITVAVIVLILAFAHQLELYLPDLEAWVQQLGGFAPLGFMGLFVLLTPVFISVDALCFGAGLLFPFLTAEICIIISTYTAAALIFYCGRYVFREKVLELITKHQRFAALDSVMSGDKAFKMMLLLRLTPLPFALLSYALSTTQVKFRPYLAATSGILIYNGSLVYLGYTTKHLTGLVTSQAARHLPYPLLILALVLTLAVLLYISKMAEHALKDLNGLNHDG